MAKIVSDDMQNMNELMHEANLIKSMKHPAIPVIYDIEEFNNSICIIEEYIAGKSLREYIHDRSLNTDDILRIGKEICEILEYMHNYNESGVIHLDIKPDNIIIDNKGKVKLVDFGNSIAEGEIKTRYEGSIFYAAPEQYTNPSPGKASDIYSLGMLLLYMADNGNQSLNIDVDSICHKKLCPIIKKCIRHKSNKRYKKIEDVKADIEKNLRKTEKSDKRNSYIIYTAGTRSGIGTTHISLSIAHFFKKKGLRCIVADATDNQHIFSMALAGELTKTGVFSYKNIDILPDYYDRIEPEIKAYDIAVIDCGSYTDDINEDDGGLSHRCNTIRRISDYAKRCMKDGYREIHLMAAGGRYGIAEENDKILDFIRSNGNNRKVLFVNLVDVKGFYEFSKGMTCDCYRVPCIYDWTVENPIFEDSMNELIKDYMPEINAFLTGKRKEILKRELNEKVHKFYRKIKFLKKKNFFIYKNNEKNE